jgi:hypothetical protein
MPNLIALGAGASATALTLVLGLTFWPQIETSLPPGKAAISQPIFVKSLASAAPVANAAPAAGGADDAAAMAKLAVALQAAPSAPSGNSAATGSMTLAAASPASPPPVSEAARRLCAQGLVALAAGDIVSARLYLERAAEIGDVRALMVLGESYDPVTLARMGAMGIKGDTVKARDYYAKALAAGMGAARERMAALEAP